MSKKQADIVVWLAVTVIGAILFSTRDGWVKWLGLGQFVLGILVLIAIYVTAKVTPD